MITLRHNLIDLALHELRAGDGRPLLVLHGLGEATPAEAPPLTAGWRGPVVGLDLTGHGASSSPVGGGYTAEILMADVDIALAHLGPATVLGRGLGAYVAVLIAGARPALVRGAVLADGPGLTGGSVGPASSDIVVVPDADGARTPDPYALAELTRDVRPPDYATTFVRSAVQLSGLAVPVAVAARVRPAWLRAVVDEPGVVEESVEAALARFGELTHPSDSGAGSVVRGRAGLSPSPPRTGPG